MSKSKPGFGPVAGGSPPRPDEIGEREKKMTNETLKSEKAKKIIRRLESFKVVDNATLTTISDIIADKLRFYDHCLKSWDNPTEKFNNTEDISRGRDCCNAGLDIADAIVNEMRIEYLPSK